MSCAQLARDKTNANHSQILMSSQTTPASSSAAPQLGSAATAAASGGCCESGRPIITDPLTGQTVCSCQYDPQTQLLNYQRLASAGLPIYSAPYGEQGYLPLTAEQSAFYTPNTNGFELKDNLSTWPYAASVYYPYDTTLAGYPFANGYGVDLNGARRKNATRETTSTLKAWLNEHKKNPYPTKGEKIMLAIITKMTLTQVSTWFANARRRLKKENKMTWEPRNRVDDEDNNVDNGDTMDKDDRPRDSDRGTMDSPLHISRESLVPHHQNPSGTALSLSSDCDKLSDDTCVRVVTDDEDDDDDDDKSISVSIGHDGLEATKADGLLLSDSLSSPSSVLSDQASSIHSPLSVDSQPPSAHQGTDVIAPHKPRIWSIVDTATSNSTPTGSHPYQTHTLGAHPSSMMGATGSMSKVSPLARSLRLEYASPYPKPTWFNGSYGNASGATDSLLASFNKPSFIGGGSTYSLTSALTTSTLSSATRPCVQNMTAINKALPPSMATLQRNNPSNTPRFHGAFTLNSKLDCQVHQDQRQELQGPAS